MKKGAFWVLTKCISETTRPYGGKYHLHLQGREVIQARSSDGLFPVLHLILKTEPICSSETYGSLQTTLWYYQRGQHCS
jgi:hypothetical protein